MAGPMGRPARPAEKRQTSDQLDVSRHGGTTPLDVDVGLLASDALVSDNVNVPLETPLLAAAKARELSTSNGLDMLLHHAVSAFELWFGVRPEVTQDLYDLLAADTIAS